MKSLKSGLAVSLAVLFSAACTATVTTNTNNNTNRNGSVPVAATPTPTANANTAAANSNTAGAASAIDAAALYNNETAPKCASCHNADGKGNPAMKTSMKDLPDFTDAAWQKKETDAELIETIKNGHKPMPAYKDKLSDDQIKALVAYVRKFAS
jgi:mono/diheme cytochrome c family protein